MEYRTVPPSDVPDINFLKRRVINHAACMVGKYIYVFSGYTAGRTVEGFARLDTSELRWEVPESSGITASPRCGHIIVAVDDLLVVEGGWNSSDKFELESKSLNVFDVCTGIWYAPEETGDVPPLTYLHSMNYIKSKHLFYRFGGKNYHGSINELIGLNLENWSWSRLQSRGAVPSPRSMHACCVIGDRLYLYGGKTPVGGWHGDLYVLEIDKILNFWTNIKAYGRTPPNMGGSSLTCLNGKLYLMGGIGGEVNANTGVCCLYQYDIREKHWMKAAEESAEE